MKITTVLAATVATAGAVIAAPIAGAETGVPAGPAVHEIGQQADLVNGAVVQGWTVTDLKTSTDTIPYAVRGTLWEATATDEAVQGAAIPIVSNFNARAKNGETYRALWQVATPQGVNPATLGQGQETTGKLYFDVTGAQPDSVVYNDGGQDLLLWVQPAPSSTPSSPRSSSSPSGSATSSAPQAAEATPPVAAEAVEPVEPVEPGAPGAPAPASAELVPAPAASAGTPLPATSAGTPLPATSAGTPLPATSAGTPLPVGAQGTPVPAGSQGTPALAPAPAAPAAPAPAPAAPAVPAAPAAPAPQPASNGPAPIPVSTGDEAPVPHGGLVLPTPTPVP
ncbi:MPT63 family protein [Mycolicibacterium baixiangningiae]|uniref:MPT63 family protein n=1 Tax=Mycolicibacterium baixiangningiae TaxID=2761578 RepID=UPI0018D02F4D|nr:MPT63 family protein [Mycolicibacterium baixiangningiae]